MASIPCPEHSELLNVVLGGTVPAAVRQHLDACGACRVRVERLGTQIAELREVAADLPPAPAGQSLPIASEPETASLPSGTDFGDDGSAESGAMNRPSCPESIGRYRVIGQVNSGGQALVYRAVHPTLPRDVVIKIAHVASPIDKSLLRTDAEILCELDHPKLVRVYDLDLHEGRPFVAMEFVRGQNLQQLAEQSHPRAREAAALVAEIARALAYIHRRGVVHQDVKPSNILLDEACRPRLIDFGMARWRDAWSSGRRDPSGGTLAFMAPEQARGKSQRVGATSDIFALGGVFYFLLTGQAPFGGATRKEQWRRARACDFDRAALRTRKRAALRTRKVPRQIGRIILKAMSAEPEDRYASADKMADALDNFLARPRRLAFQAGTLLLAAVTAGAWSIRSRPSDVPFSTPPSASTTQPPAVSARAASLAVAPPPIRPLRIESLGAALYRRDPKTKADRPLGQIGPSGPEAFLGDNVRIQARLSVPAYCYLIALNPDGSIQSCYPEEPGAGASRRDSLEFPGNPLSGFGLTDGVGIQAFVVVASVRALPPLEPLRSELAKDRWRRSESDVVWRYNGERWTFDPALRRGPIRTLADLPQPLGETCRALKAKPGIEAIHALAFPVSNRQDSMNQ
jgi:serine/threonine protein kinase